MSGSVSAGKVKLKAKHREPLTCLSPNMYSICSHMYLQMGPMLAYTSNMDCVGPS